jgi:hypothetical protein
VDFTETAGVSERHTISIFRILALKLEAACVHGVATLNNEITQNQFVNRSYFITDLSP